MDMENIVLLPIIAKIYEPMHAQIVFFSKAVIFFSKIYVYF